MSVCNQFSALNPVISSNCHFLCNLKSNVVEAYDDGNALMEVLLVNSAHGARVAKTCQPCKPVVLFFLAGANFWEKHAKTGEKTALFWC